MFQCPIGVINIAKPNNPSTVGVRMCWVLRGKSRSGDHFHQEFQCIIINGQQSFDSGLPSQVSETASIPAPNGAPPRLKGELEYQCPLC